MSRRAIVLLVVFLGVLVVGNIIVLAIWLPARRTVTSKPESTSPIAAATQPAVAPAQSPIASSRQPATPPSGFVSERQIISSSGHVQLRYLRDRQSKMRRIVVEDPGKPGVSAVLCESKYNAWALVSPDDRWIAVDERNPTDGGGAKLYHRNGNSSVQYAVADGNGPEGRALQDTIWQTYLNATHTSSNTPRHGVTIDATGWENDSRKLNISVAYLPTHDNADVPEPWSCTYDVTSKQAEPIPNQPVVNPDAANASAASADDAAQDQGQDAGQETTAGNASADNSPDSETEAADDNEYPGEKFPATRLDELTVPDVNESSLSDITYAINEMFARHGAEFKDKKVAKEFSEFSWYKPRPGFTFDDAEKEFSDLEKQNLKVLGRCRDAKVAAAHRTSRPGQGQRGHEESTSEQILRGFRTWQDLGAPIPPHP